MNFPNQRFVCIRLNSETNLEHTLTFLMSESDDHSDPKDNGVIQHIAQSDSAKAAKLAELLSYLKKNETIFFDWLEQSAANSMLFAANPVQAIQTALPNAPICDFSQ